MLAVTNVIAAAALGSNIYSMLGVLFVTIPFFYVTLESYFKGGLFLPILNGPSDAPPLIQSIFYSAAIFGSILLMCFFILLCRTADMVL